MDLFVRVSNVLAIAMYERLGYVVYRQVEKYYSGEEDAYGASFVQRLLLPCVCMLPSSPPPRTAL